MQDSDDAIEVTHVEVKVANLESFLERRRRQLEGERRRPGHVSRAAGRDNDCDDNPPKGAA